MSNLHVQCNFRMESGSTFRFTQVLGLDADPHHLTQAVGQERR